ncbi:helix-turn-helix transcriptional regulator [Raineyella fluvialis]|uniref:WYL domain-containing protein n=1 Tax=Raineyella fluvialis TaxID=2662261 RepID=A0A5Q2FGC1_9ACTN|nr:WYL domain-containing protein [Raineyella fluvialis]QGF24847.1 WYL domain-containing protein [Raineyella fluvialis]
MASTATEQVPRLLALSTWLRGLDETTVEDVAREFGVTVDQAREDVRLLTMCQLPGQLGFYVLDLDFDALEEGIIRPSLDNAPTMPARFSADEAVTLLVGLQVLAETSTGRTAQVVESARAKIAAVAGEHAAMADRFRLKVASGTPEVREAVDRALAVRRSLALDYVDAQGRASRRTVDALGTKVVDGYHYLEAWDLDRADRRSFRMDRIRVAEVLSRAALDHGGAAEGPPSWIRQLEHAEQIRLWVRPAARWLVEYYPTTEVRAVTPEDDLGPDREPSDGDLIVTLGVLDPSWLTGLLLRFGADVVLLDPPDAGEGALERARATLTLYENAAGTPRTSRPAGPGDDQGAQVR